MIIYYLLQFLTFVGETLTKIFGKVDTLPFGTDAPLSLFFGWISYIQIVMWPLVVVVQVTAIYLGWRLSLKVYGTIMGSRAVIN